jgi:hypothetical protein
LPRPRVKVEVEKVGEDLNKKLENLKQRIRFLENQQTEPSKRNLKEAEQEPAKPSSFLDKYQKQPTYQDDHFKIKVAVLIAVLIALMSLFVVLLK